MGKKSEVKDKKKEDAFKDERFSSVHSDPRFRRPNLKKMKVKVDDRFGKQELEKLNKRTGGAKVDRYGRLLKEDDGSKTFDRYFEQEEEKDDVEASASNGEESSSSEETSSDKEEEKVTRKDLDAELKESDSTLEPVVLDRARGEGLMSSLDDESSLELELEIELESLSESEESEIELEESKPIEGDPTDAFAVVNMDWDNVRAVDLMATFSSFVPSGGNIKSITIYPSEYGKEQMQKEEIEGPPKELFRSKKASKTAKEEDSDSDIDVTNQEGLARAAKRLYEEDDGTEDYDSKALRRYQLQRLRYFYAVVKCDSVATAKNIYENCDATEYESTANIFDLRYIPEGMEFDPTEARDSCTKIPSDYKPATFFTDALQHSKVKLTWDETPKERLNLANKLFSQRELEEMDFKAYIASDSEGSDADERSAKSKYASLIGKALPSGEDGDDDDIDMEITFDPALKEEEEKPTETEETTIEKYRRKEKERRKQRMKKLKEAQEKSQSASSEADKRTQPRNTLARNDANADEQKQAAELELLMMDEEKDGTEHEHFDMKEVFKAEKQKKRKGKKSEQNTDNETSTNDFVPDLNDPRFKEIFEDHDFAIDPTREDFKKTKAMAQIMQERSKRSSKHSKPSSKKRKNNPSVRTSGPSEIQSLVKKLKQKHQNK